MKNINSDIFKDEYKINNEQYIFIPVQEEIVTDFLDKIKLGSIPDDTKILVSEVVDMESEYRCFIHKGKLVGSKNYTGDFTKNLNLKLRKNG